MFTKKFRWCDNGKSKKWRYCMLTLIPPSYWICQLTIKFSKNVLFSITIFKRQKSPSPIQWSKASSLPQFLHLSLTTASQKSATHKMSSNSCTQKAVPLTTLLSLMEFAPTIHAWDLVVIRSRLPFVQEHPLPPFQIHPKIKDIKTHDVGPKNRTENRNKS